MKSLTVKMPAFLASALVNGDTSGLSCTCEAEDNRQGDGECLACAYNEVLDNGSDWIPPGGLGSIPEHTCRQLQHPNDIIRGEVVSEEPTSGLYAKHTGDCDFRWLKAALDYCAPGRVVSAEGEQYFSCSCDLPDWHLGADILDYVVLCPKEG